ncbi:MAG: Rpn family recombination-promoting nuclease/putative transposase [Blautia sp.]|nr:Rpn family recombination-promoting nuclease/putative transposase [Blautia sp.]
MDMETEQTGSMDFMQPIQTKWEELSISNDFMFGKVMQDPELCKELLQRILPDLKIDHIEYPELQKSIKPDMDARSVRLDVYVQDDKEVVYDIEMQVSDTKELPRRSRYYQSMIDLQLIDKGQHYKRLNRSYIIFICSFDAYGKGRHIYTFENTCKEDNSILMGDETVKIFLNANGTMDDVSGGLKAFLDYVAGKKPEDSYVEKLEEAVREARKNREWRHEYMTLLMRDQENMEQGRKQGIFGMISVLRDLDIPDSTILQKLQEKFQLTKEESQEYLSR